MRFQRVDYTTYAVAASTWFLACGGLVPYIFLFSVFALSEGEIGNKEKYRNRQSRRLA
jgi:hypothetical protein